MPTAVVHLITRQSVGCVEITDASHHFILQPLSLIEVGSSWSNADQISD